MATDKNIKKFSVTDIERYHQGLLSDKERHDLEKAALDDPFLADALEGYAVAGIDMHADLAELKNRLAQRTERSRVVEMVPRRGLLSPMLRVAAMLILLAGAGLLVYQFAFNKGKDEVAETKIKDREDTKKTDTGLTTAPSSETVSSQEAKPVGVKPNPGSTTTFLPEKRNEVVSKADGLKTETATTDKLITDPEPGSSAAAPVTPPAPVKANETDDGLTRTANPKNAVKEREEVKTRAVAAKKQQADRAAAKDQVTNQPADEKNERSVALEEIRKADNPYYRNQAMNTFRGRVTDASNTGVPFANVTNVRDNVGTYTDANGNFTLTSTDTVLDVQVRSLGYDQSNTQLRNAAPANQIVLQEDRRNLSEVVVSTRKPNAAARSKQENRKLIEPEPADGWEKYDSYLANNLNIPEDFRQQKANDNNSVQVSFEVDKNGEPVNIRIEKSLCASCDKEAIRLVKEGPKWKRTANKKGRTTVTINF